MDNVNEVIEEMTENNTVDELTEVAENVISEPKSGGNVLAVAGGVVILGAVIALGYKYAFVPIRKKISEKIKDRKSKSKSKVVDHNDEDKLEKE